MQLSEGDDEEVERQRLRRAPGVVAIIREFWDIMVMESAKFDLGIVTGCVNREGYRNLHLRVSKALAASFDLGNAESMADKDWAEDITSFSGDSKVGAAASPAQPPPPSSERGVAFGLALLRTGRRRRLAQCTGCQPQPCPLCVVVAPLSEWCNCRLFHSLCHSLDLRRSCSGWRRSRRSSRWRPSSGSPRWAGRPSSISTSARYCTRVPALHYASTVNIARGISALPFRVF